MARQSFGQGNPKQGGSGIPGPKPGQPGRQEEGRPSREQQDMERERRRREQGTNEEEEEEEN